MEPDLLGTLGRIAGIGGIALGVFLLLFRDVIRQKIFPQLTKKQSYRILLTFMILTWSVAIAGIVAWMVSRQDSEELSRSRGAQVLTASLWNVELDSKGSLMATTEVPAAVWQLGERAALDSVVAFIAGRLGVADSAMPSAAEVRVRIPAELQRGAPSIERVPSGVVEALLWETSEGDKLRTPLSASALRNVSGDYHLEIRAPGYGAVVLSGRAGQALDTALVIESSPVSIGLEEFAGEGAGIAERLAQRLGGHGRFRVVSPSMLEAVRREVEAHNRRIRENPMVQLPLRELGVDYILSGSVRSE